MTTDPTPDGAVPTVLIAAGGRGVRMGGEIARPKTILPVGRESIIENILRAVDSLRPRWRTVVATRKDDTSRSVERHLAERDIDGLVDQIVPVAAASYLDSVAIVMERLPALPAGLTVLDSDLWTSPANLRHVLARFCSSSPAVVASFAVSARPASEDPRSIRLAQADDGSLVQATDRAAPRTIGAYWWSPQGQAMISSFVSSGEISFHRFVDELVARRIPASLIEIDESHNLNVPADFEAALRYRERLGPRWMS
jgi:molybdopterin-guanine dinucleotide biosynthesis protein A